MPTGLYLDSSVLVSIYTEESTTPQAEALIAGASSLSISDLTVLEVRTAMERKRKSGVVEAEEVESLRAVMQAAMANGHLRRIEVTAADYEAADAISRRVVIPLRSLDALHAAIAERSGLELVTLDQRLRDAAKAAGIAAG